jgi:hypothetical protein
MSASTRNLATRTRTAPVVQTDSQARANSGVVSTVATVLLSCLASNKGATQLYLMFFDATTLPANATVPLFQSIPIPAAGQISSDLTVTMSDFLAGVQTQAGLVWAASTTQDTLTVDTSTSTWTTIRTCT